MNTVAYIPILTNDYYNTPIYYRFMPASIFNELEKSFINGTAVAYVPETDFIKMIAEINLNDGSKDN